MSSKKALLIIDMQKGSFTNETPRHDATAVVDRINKLASVFRQQNSLVIFVQHDGLNSGSFEKNSWEWENLDTLTTHVNDLYIDKYANDIFYQSRLEQTLQKLQIQELYITGCATDFCVEATVQSALTKDYKITVVADGHTTANRPHLSAKKIIEHYNWTWQNMLPTKGSLQVYSFNKILKLIS